MASQKQVASRIVQQIRELNSRMAVDQFKLSKLLFTLHTSSLHLEFGYESFREFCDEELPISYTGALTQVSMFKQLKRLRYNQTESVELLTRLGVTKCRQVLPTLKSKQSVARVAKQYGHNGASFTIHVDPDELRLIEKKLLKHGLHVNENGRRLNMSGTVTAALLAS